MRRQPIARQNNGTYVATTHAVIRRLIFDPRISSEDLPLSHRPKTGNLFKDWFLNRIKDRISNAHRPLIFRDPPAHDALRDLVMEEFTTKRVAELEGSVRSGVNGLIDACRGRTEVCLVGDLSYPLPVAVICELLGVPEEDEPKFQHWSTQLATALEPDARRDEATRAETMKNFDEISGYMRALIAERRAAPKSDMLSGLIRRASEKGSGADGYDLIATSILLLIAGHETTVNLITNGMLTLLRRPDELERLKADPERAPRVIEELLRFEPPVHFRTRKALDDIDIDGVTIPKGAPVILLLASGNRDPERFQDPDSFNPDRTNNQHFGFGGGLHYCIGAPLARLETEIALVSLCKRLIRPRLTIDPPPYRPGASLRGPKRLDILVDSVS